MRRARVFILLMFCSLPIPLGPAVAADAPQVDRFGGRKDLHLTEPGKFFRTFQEGPRWWLVTPEGNAFLAPGVNHLTSIGDSARQGPVHPYRDNLMAKYGSIEAWSKTTASRLHDWGFTTLGAWCSREVGEEFPYTLELSISGGLWGQGVPDVFSPEYRQHIEERAQSTRKFADDPYLIGYYLDNELPWAPDWRLRPDVFHRYVSLPAHSPGKQRLVAFFQERYATPERMAEVWKVTLGDWPELAGRGELLPRDHARAKEDREAFTLLVAREHFKATTAAIRRHDPNHLILGCRFVWRTVPKVVVQACGETCDVVSINYYEVAAVGEVIAALLDPGVDRMPQNPSFRSAYELTKKPLIVTEFSFRSDDSGVPNTYPPGFLLQPTVRSQQERAAKYRHFATLWIGSPYMVGYHWFQYMDEPKVGRCGDGENGNYGLVTIEDEPYDEFVDVVREVNRQAWALHQAAQ